MVPTPFAMWLGEHGGVLTVRLAGRFEAPWVEEVRRELLRHSPAALGLDISALTAVDPAGLATLLAVRQGILSGGGRFDVRGASEGVRATFAAAGLDALVDDEPVTAPEPEPVTHLPLNGGLDARRSPAATSRVA